MGSLDRSFDRYDDGKPDILFHEESLSPTDSKMIDSYEGINVVLNFLAVY